jgi:hypothetical protein
MSRASALAGRGATRWRWLLSSMLRQSPARGVLQQVGANGHGQGFGRFGSGSAGFALQHARDVFFAVQPRHQCVVQ